MTKNDNDSERPDRTKRRTQTDKGDVFKQGDLPEKIGQNLRQIYDDVLSEPVPDDFLSLLEQADNAKN